MGGGPRSSMIALKRALSELETAIELLRVDPFLSRNEVAIEARLAIEKVTERIRERIRSS
jgi:hypothetical protein